MKQFLTIQLPNPVTVKALGNKDVQISQIDILEMIDSPYNKTVWVVCRNHPKRILLWEGEAYDAIGQWTETDVENRVIELYS